MLLNTAGSLRNWWKGTKALNVGGVRMFLLLLLFLSLYTTSKPVALSLYAFALTLYGGARLLDHSISQIEIERSAPRTYLFQGETASIRLSLRNRSKLPVAWISGFDRLPTELTGGRFHRWVVSLRSRGQAEVEYQVRPSRRGVYTAGPIELTAGDPLGLHQVSATVSSLHDIVAYPEILPIENLSIPSRIFVGNARNPKPLHHDPSKFAGVREYRPGDPSHWIHWKSTARVGRVHVKQFEHTLALQSVVLLNLHLADYQLEPRRADPELAITTTASIAHHISLQEAPFGLVVNGKLTKARDREEKELDHDIPVRVGSGSGASHLIQALETLAMVEAAPALPFGPLVYDEMRRFPWGSAVFLVTPQDTEELVRTATLLWQSGHPVWLLVTSGRVIHRHLQGTDHSGPRVVAIRRTRERSLMVMGERSEAR